MVWDGGRASPGWSSPHLSDTGLAGSLCSHVVNHWIFLLLLFNLHHTFSCQAFCSLKRPIELELFLHIKKREVSVFPPNLECKEVGMKAGLKLLGIIVYVSLCYCLVLRGNRDRTPRTQSRIQRLILPTLSTILNKKLSMIYMKCWESCSMADLPVNWGKMVTEKKYCQYLGLV